MKESPNLCSCEVPLPTTMIRFEGVLTLCVLLLVGSGCTDSGEPRSTPADTPPTASSSAPDTSSSGMKRYETPPGFPLPFTTTVPAGWREQHVDRSVGKTIRFYQDAKLKSPVFEMYLYQPSATKKGVRKRIRSEAGDMGTVSDHSPDYSWAFASFAFQGDTMEGVFRAGKRDSLLFYVMTSRPTDADSTFARQAQSVLDHWKWQ